MMVAKGKITKSEHTHSALNTRFMIRHPRVAVFPDIVTRVVAQFPHRALTPRGEHTSSSGRFSSPTQFAYCKAIKGNVTSFHNFFDQSA